MNLSIFIIALTEEKYQTALNNILEIDETNFDKKNIQKWTAVRGKDLVEEVSFLRTEDKHKYKRLKSNYRNIIKEKYPFVSLPTTPEQDLLSLQTKLSLLGSGSKETLTVSDIHNEGALGCYLSHVSLWQHIVKNKIKGAIIFEEDVNLVKNKKDELEQFIAKETNNDGWIDRSGRRMGLEMEKVDILNFNACYFNHGVRRATFSEDTTNSPFKRLLGLSFVTQGYYISYKGAEKLLKNAFPVTCAVDSYISLHTLTSIVDGTEFNFYVTKEPWLDHGQEESTIGYGNSFWTENLWYYINSNLKLGFVVGTLIYFILSLLLIILLVFWLRNKQKNKKINSPNQF